MAYNDLIRADDARTKIIQGLVYSAVVAMCGGAFEAFRKWRL